MGLPSRQPARGAGVGDELGAVVRQNGLASGDAGQDALAAAGKACKEMGLDKAIRDQQVGIQRVPVEPQRAARGQDAEVAQAGAGLAVVNDDPFRIANPVAKLGAQFAVAGGPVATGGDQNRDADSGVAATQPCQQKRQGDVAGHGAGVVAGDDRRRLLPDRQRLKQRGFDRVIQGLFDAVSLVVQRRRRAGRAVLTGRDQDSTHLPGGNIRLRIGSMVGQAYAHLFQKNLPRAAQPRLRSHRVLAAVAAPLSSTLCPLPLPVAAGAAIASLATIATVSSKLPSAS